MKYHVLCGKHGDKAFPISIFVEKEGEDPVYITLSEFTDDTLLDYEDSLHYVPIEEATKEWPVIEIALVDAKSVGVI